MTPLPASPPNAPSSSPGSSPTTTSRGRERTVDAVTSRHAGESRFSAAQVDASDAGAVAALAREVGATHVFNAVDPRFVLSIFEGAKAAGADYLDMAMSLSQPAPERALRQGRRQARRRPAGAGRRSGRPTAGSPSSASASSPGLSDVFARYAADHLFSHIDELGTRDGANLVIRDEEGNEVFAPGFSMWTIIEECLNPPVVWEREKAVGADGSYDVEAGFSTLPPFSEPEVFDFPEGIGPVECVHVEHEEVLLMPRWVDADKVTFKYGLGEEMITILRTLHTLGLDGTDPVTVKGVQVSPRDVVAAVLPDPATIGPRMEGKTCAGLWVTGTGKDGSRAARTSTTCRTTPTRCATTTPSASSGRPPSTPSSRSSCSPRAPGPERACSAPRRSTPCRSSTCSPPRSPRATARRGASRTAEAR